jgi:hypothetical protein
MARKPGKRETVGAGAKNPDDPKPQQNAAGDVEADRQDRIRRRAYQIWEEEGWPEGRQVEHWTRAEREAAESAGPGPEPRTGEDRSRAVAPPKSRKRPGAAAKLGGAPSAPAAGKGRGE